MKEFKFLPWTAPLFEDWTYYVISGSRASGKSTNVAAYFLVKLMGDEYFRGVVSRFTQKSISNSIYRDILDLIEDWGLTRYLEIKGDEIKNKLNCNLIITHAMKLQEGTMTAKGKGLSEVTHLLIDEAVEIGDEMEYLKLVDSFRHKGSERKIFLLFNPSSTNHWIYKRFYLPDGKPNPKWSVDHCFIHCTYLDNLENLDPKKVEEVERMKIIDPEYYRTQWLGEWSPIGQGAVYKHFQWGLPAEFKKEDFKEILYGLDFGFASDPSAIIRVYRNNKTLYLEEVVYERGLILEELAELMKKRGIPLDAKIVADSAEPRSIETLKRLGFRNIQPCIKGTDSIRIGIDKVKSYTVYADPNSKNLISEVAEYIYNHLGKPVGADHLLDSLRYSLSESSGSGTYGFAGNQTRRDWSRG
jgi:phage terminase large subunit